MRLGILQAGLVPDDLAERHGSFIDMFSRLYQHANSDLDVRDYEVVNDAFPEQVTDCDIWLITGSKHGVYENLPWMARLKEFLRSARAARVPMIGICFGHQIMAEAFGGRAEKSEKGWGCGPHDYSVVARPSWLAEASDGFTMHAMHQDQVTAIPDDATRLAVSPFCENAMLVYGDPEAPDAISIQPHPEFSDGFMQALLEMRSGAVVPTETASAAQARLGTSLHGDAFARWSIACAVRMLSAKDPAS